MGALLLRADAVGLFASNANLQAAASSRGSIYLFLSNVSFGPERRWRMACGSDTPESLGQLRAMLTTPPTAEAGRLGFRIVRGPKDAFGISGGRFCLLIVPHWLLVTLRLSNVRLRDVLREINFAAVYSDSPGIVKDGKIILGYLNEPLVARL